MIRNFIAAVLCCELGCCFALATDSTPPQQDSRKASIASSKNERADQALKAFAAAEKLHTLGDLLGARDKYSEVLSLFPQPLALLRRGLCHEGIGDLENAKADFAAVTKVTYATQEIKEEGMAGLKRVVFMLSKEDEITLGISDHLILTGERIHEELLRTNLDGLPHFPVLVQAAAQLTALKSRAPKHAPTYLRLGHIYDLAGLPQSARANYERYVQLHEGLDVTPDKSELKVRARLQQIAKEPHPENPSEVRWYERTGRKIAGGPLPSNKPGPQAIHQDSSTVERAPNDQWTQFTTFPMEITTTEPSYWKVSASARFRGHSLAPEFALRVNCNGAVGLVVCDSFGPGADNLVCNGTVKLPPGKHTFVLLGAMPDGKGLPAANPYEIEGWRLDIEPILPLTPPAGHADQ